MRTFWLAETMRGEDSGSDLISCVHIPVHNILLATVRGFLLAGQVLQVYSQASSIGWIPHPYLRLVPAHPPWSGGLPLPRIRRRPIKNHTGRLYLAPQFPTRVLTRALHVDNFSHFEMNWLFVKNFFSVVLTIQMLRLSWSFHWGLISNWVFILSYLTKNYCLELESLLKLKCIL